MKKPTLNEICVQEDYPDLAKYFAVKKVKKQ
jgi:hypothetical protein